MDRDLKALADLIELHQPDGMWNYTKQIVFALRAQPEVVMRALSAEPCLPAFRETEWRIPEGGRPVDTHTYWQVPKVTTRLSPHLSNTTQHQQEKPMTMDEANMMLAVAEAKKAEAHARLMNAQAEELEINNKRNAPRES